MLIDMTRMNISLTDEQIKQLKDLSIEENRPYSKQILHMMEQYLIQKHTRTRNKTRSSLTSTHK